MAEFTAHNIVLPSGVHTWPGNQPLAESSRCQAALQLLGEQFRPAVRAQTAVADLGCLEGGYTVAFARAGYQVTGVEARALNMAKCEMVASLVALPNMRFVHDDARNLTRYGPFDAVFCCGLLYHLDKPAAFLQMLGGITRRMVIIQSHYSGSCHEENEGFRGHWYNDAPEETNLWGSYGNARSFWLGQDELLRAVREAGFTKAWAHDDGTRIPDRGMFAGVKP